jgi:hypothetical protein
MARRGQQHNPTLGIHDIFDPIAGLYAELLANVLWDCRLPFISQG